MAEFLGVTKHQEPDFSSYFSAIPYGFSLITSHQDGAG